MSDNLRERARRWLKNAKKCHTRIVGHAYTAGRAPDVVGFASADKVYLIICVRDLVEWEAIKVNLQSRNDYRIGGRRYLLAPPGLLSFSEVPLEWGILEAGPHKITIAASGIPAERSKRTIRNENALLLSVIKKYGATTGQDPDVFFKTGYAEYTNALQGSKGASIETKKAVEVKKAVEAAYKKEDSAVKRKVKTDAKLIEKDKEADAAKVVVKRKSNSELLQKIKTEDAEKKEVDLKRIKERKAKMQEARQSV